MKPIILAWIVMCILTIGGYIYLIEYTKRRMKEDKMQINHRQAGKKPHSIIEWIYEFAVVIIGTICPIIHVMVFSICAFFPYLVYNQAISQGMIIDDTEDE